MKNLYTLLKVQLLMLIISHCMFGQVKKIFYSGTNVTIEVSGSIFGNNGSPPLNDPYAGVLVWGVSNEQDGSANVAQVLQGTHYYKSQPDMWSFISNPAVDYVYVSAIHHRPHVVDEGSFNVKVNSVDYTITMNNVIFLEDFYPSKVKKINYSGTNVTIEVSGSIYGKDLSPPLDDPFAGVLVWGVSNEQDGSAVVAQILQGTHYYKSQPDVWSFTSNPAIDYIYVSAIHHRPHIVDEGSFNVKVNGVDYTVGLDNVIYLEEEIIPVELASFTALTSKGKVTLNWTTATETNNQMFEVERGIEDGQFITIGYVEGHGTTTATQEYQFIDNISDIQATSLSYRLKQIDYDGSYEYSEVVEVTNLAPTDYVLQQNYPNPFNPVTTISYSLPVKSKVELVVYNTLGESVIQLVNEHKDAGRYTVKFSAKSLPSGIYFYRIQSGSFVETKKMILMK